MQALVVGDIHACWDEFRELLDLAGISDADKIIAVGDIVDRGPEPWKVVRFFQGNSRAYCILGNHERKHLRASGGKTKMAISQEICREQIGQRDYPAALEFMANLPLWNRQPGAVIVHGFWEPGVPFEKQREDVLAGATSGSQYIFRNCGAEWYKSYEGQVPLIVGHLDYLRTGLPLIWNDKVFCIDTGCATGGRLTGLLLPSFRIVSVPSRMDYWSVVKSKYASVVARGHRYNLVTSLKKKLDRIDVTTLTFGECREVIGVANDLTEAYPELKVTLEELAQEIHSAEELAPLLVNRIFQEAGSVLARLRETRPDFDSLSGIDKGRVFHAEASNSSYPQLLHMARLGTLDKEAVERFYRTPGALVRATLNRS